MDNERLSHGLALLAEDMPAPDVENIVSTARIRVQRRRAVGATLIGTAAAITLITGSLVLAVPHSPANPTAANSTGRHRNAATIDDRARTLDQQLNRANLIPAGLTVAPDPANPIQVDGRVLGLEFSTSSTAPAGSVIADGTGNTIAQAPASYRTYELDVTLADSTGWGTLSVVVTHTSSDNDPTPSCVAEQEGCQLSELPDGTTAEVLSTSVPDGSGTAISLAAVRPDGTYIEVHCTDQATANSPQTAPQPPLNQAEVLAFATAFTY